MEKEPAYTKEPEDKQKFTDDFDGFYSKFATVYDLAVRLLPLWKTWIRKAVPHIRGPRVLEVSFGTGHLLAQYADRFETYGLDYNRAMVALTGKKLAGKGLSAKIREGSVEALPYEDGFFDCLVNTMAFSGYPDGVKALSEMRRVLRSGGRLILVDIGYPKNRNRPGMLLTRFWAHAGDIIRDMDSLLTRFGFDYEDIEIGGFGSVHLYLAEKPAC